MYDSVRLGVWIVFFFNDTATTEIYTLSLHDALPIYVLAVDQPAPVGLGGLVAPPVLELFELVGVAGAGRLEDGDRKSTRLNSSHANISYAVFCLKKKNSFSINLRTHFLIFYSCSSIS